MEIVRSSEPIATCALHKYFTCGILKWANLWAASGAFIICTAAHLGLISTIETHQLDRFNERFTYIGNCKNLCSKEIGVLSFKNRSKEIFNEHFYSRLALEVYVKILLLIIAGLISKARYHNKYVS